VAVELGPVSLELLTHVAVRERARLARHAIPGMNADVVQVLGRPSVEVFLRGIFFGPEAGEDLKRLRTAYLGQEPVDFFAEAVGDGYFAQVLITRLDVAQASGRVDEFEFCCEVVEYAEPPSPLGVDPLAAVDAELAGEALAFVDSVQDALDGVSKLGELMTSMPEFGNPTVKLPDMRTRFETKLDVNKLRDGLSVLLKGEG
jgi:hypothetical protein